ncbi:MAG: anhydro-N-acetylmuramic acid kinase [Planctomycetota bacterium]
MTEQRTRVVAGCMTGTSLDGLDVALVKITGTGLEMKAELLGHHALPLPDGLRTTLMSLASGEAKEPIVYMRAARALGELHADGIEQLIAYSSLSLEGEGRGEGEAQSTQSTNDKHNARKLDFVTAHGQTIWHAPRDDQGPKSWQLFDPWPIVKRLNVPVCYDLRQADLIAGGQGAPLTPIADWVMYRGKGDFICNLGGIMNSTRLFDKPAHIRASDDGPCNLLLDGLCQRFYEEAFDRDGLHASEGTYNAQASKLIGDAIHDVDRHGSKGREQFSDQWLNDLNARFANRFKPEDILRTVLWRISHSIETDGTDDLRRRKNRIVLAGGGARNKTLVQEIVESDAETVILSDDLGIPCEAREAMAFAVLGALSQDGIPISLPQVTGATDPGVSGVWAGV